MQAIKVGQADYVTCELGEMAASATSKDKQLALLYCVDSILNTLSKALRLGVVASELSYAKIDSTK